MMVFGVFHNGLSDGSGSSTKVSSAVPLEVVTLEELDAAELYQSRLVLVRPDGHVVWRGNEAPADGTALVDHMRGAT